MKKILTTFLVLSAFPTVAAENDLQKAPSLVPCLGKATCEDAQSEFTLDWGRAFEGSYQAQRNVSFCLSDGCESVVVDKSHGCAWRLVLINRWANGDRAGVETGDTLDGEVGNLRWQCGDLAPLERDLAISLGGRLAEAIHQTPLSVSVKELLSN